MAILLPLCISFLITFLVTPLVIKYAPKFHLVDNPFEKNHPGSIQKRIVPKGGGIPIFIGIVVAIVLFIPLSKATIGIVISLTILLLIGVLDDAKDISPYIRLSVQFLSAAIVVGTGVGITFITNPFGGVLHLDSIVWTISFGGIHNLYVIADILAFFWIVWSINMLNWSGGIDGQLSGIVAVAAIVIGIVAYQLYARGDINQLNLAILSFITAGSSIAFLIFHWHPAKIFPGDSASNILGFMIAVLCILSSAKMATALLIVLIPAIDFFYTFIRRILNKKSPFFGDKKHLHHMLLRRGWSHQQIALFYIASSAILGIIAINLPPQGKLFAIIGVGVVIVGVLLWLHLFTQKVVPPPSSEEHEEKVDKTIVVKKVA